MTAPLQTGRFTITYADEPEKLRKLTAVLARMGYRVEVAAPEMLTVGELAKRTGRNLSKLSAALRSPTCPPFEAVRGKRKILRVAVTDTLMRHLTRDPRVGKKGA